MTNSFSFPAFLDPKESEEDYPVLETPLSSGLMEENRRNAEVRWYSKAYRRESGGLFAVLAGRLLQLVECERIEEFKTFFCFCYKTLCGLVTSQKTIDSLGERSYAYLHAFLRLTSYIGTDTSRSDDDPDKDRPFHASQVCYYLTTLNSQIERCFVSFFRVIRNDRLFSRNEYSIFVLTGDAHKLIKYHTVWFWNRHLRSRSSEYPKNPFPDVPLFFYNTIWKDWLIRRSSDKILMNSMFMGLKKSLPPVCPVAIEKSFEDLREDLTRKWNNGEEKEKRMRRYCKDLIGDYNVSKGSEICLNPIVFGRKASFGASYHCSRRLLGQWGELLKIYRLRPEYESIDHLTPLLRGWTMENGIMVSVVSPGPSEHEIWEWFFSLENTLRMAGNLPINGFENFDANLQPWWSEGRVKPYGILEPLKVRIITKGDAVTLTGLHPLKSLYRRLLRRVPNHVFDLIFRAIDLDKDDDTQTLVTCHQPQGLSLATSREVNNFPYFVSGDYSAATNKVNGELSLLVMRILNSLLDVPFDLAWRAERSLAGCVVDYIREETIPFEDFGFIKPDQKTGFDFVQTNGQLMGSVLSFPILCILNLFAYWESIEEYEQRHLRLHELANDYPVRINGDDILFCANEGLYCQWKETIKGYGFEPSLGKNLLLEDAFTINSVYYSVPRDLRRQDAEIVSYLNFGLLNGVKKGDGPNDTISRATQLGDGFSEYCYQPEFWVAASEAWKILISFKRPCWVSKAKEIFFETYDPYLSEQGWDRSMWEEFSHLLKRIPVKKVTGYSLCSFAIAKPRSELAFERIYRGVPLDNSVLEHLAELDLFRLDEVFGLPSPTDRYEIVKPVYISGEC
jgi:hypothetical protein